jgi:hypothetical protein
MKKIMPIVLLALFLSAAGFAAADEPYPYYEDRYAEPYYYDVPPYYDYAPKVLPKAVHVPRDIRIKIAELERLKSEINYRALPSYPDDSARAEWLADRVADLNHEIEALRRGDW